jgi:hypothetical protein
MLMALDFLAGAARAWAAVHELGLARSEGLVLLAKGRAWAAQCCLRAWLWDLQREGVL